MHVKGMVRVFKPRSVRVRYEARSDRRNLEITRTMKAECKSRLRIGGSVSSSTIAQEKM